jgi:hypothetical protein
MNAFRTFTSTWRYRMLAYAGGALLLLPQPGKAQPPEAALQTAIDSLSVERMLRDIRTLAGSPSMGGKAAQAMTCDQPSGWRKNSSRQACVYRSSPTKHRHSLSYAERTAPLPAQ